MRNASEVSGTGSIPESVASGRSNVRRYTSIHTRLERWNKGRLLADIQPHLQGRVTRTPALDLAQQAQVAACNYLGYSPREFSTSIYRPQTLPSLLSPDSSRPVELHMHHHHHHYVASPTSTFSESSSQYFEGSVSEIPTTAANELTIRIASPVPSSTTSTTTNYAVLGPPCVHGNQPQGFVHNPSQSLVHGIQPPGFVQNTSQSLVDGIQPQGLLQNQSQCLAHGLQPQGLVQNQSQCLAHGIQPQGFAQNPSQSLVHGTLHGDVDATQRYVQNILWLKNQIDESEEQNGVNKGGAKERGMMGKEFGSRSCSPLHPIVIERKPVGYTKSVLWPQDKESLQDGVPEYDIAKSKPRKTDDNSGRCQVRRPFHSYCSPYNSPSEDNSMREDTTPALSATPTISESTPSRTRNARKIMHTNGEMKGRKEAARVQNCQTQDGVASGGCAICPSGSNSTGADSKLPSNHFSRDDTASSIDGDSVRLSDKRIAWTYNSSCTESGSPRKEMSSPRRPAKKSCGARASRRQASREARAWDTVERRPQKSFCQDGREDSTCMHEMGSDIRIDDKAEENKRRCVPERGPQSQLDKGDEEGNKKFDADKPMVQAFGGHNRTQPGLKDINATQHTEIAWKTAFGKKRGLQQILNQEKNGIDKQKSEFLHDQEIDISSYTPRVEESRNREHASHNKLREAVEAAWKTSLRTKRGFEEHHEGGDLQYGDQENLKDQGCPGMSLEVDLKEQTFNETAKDKVRLYEAAWKASIGKNKGVEDDDMKDEASDHVLRDIQRDHENLKVLVAREESLQRELKDQTVARVAAEERARLAAEQKAQIYEASAKAAEEGLRVLLDERALFHSKFKEELEQGATDRLRLQELLQLEKLKLEATEGELRELRRSLQDSLTIGMRTNKNSQQEPGLDMLSLHSCAPRGLGAGKDEARLRLIAESENRIAAEAKASYFEASAKAAEGRLRKLLDERNWFFLRFKEELEHKTTNMIKLQQLMEMERANHELPDLPRKRRLDVRSLVASSVANENRNNDIEEETDRHGLEQLLELDSQSLSQDTMKGNAVSGTHHQPEQSTSIDKEGEEGLEENRKPASSVEQYDLRGENLLVKNDKKRSLSPLIPTRVQQRESDAPFSVKIERYAVEGADVATAVDISPGKGQFHSPGLDLGEILQPSGSNCQLGTESVEDIFDVRSASNLATNQSTKPSSHQPMSIPAKWKKETKAELRKMIQEQEMTWRIAEDAVDELGRRLELLERYKMDIQDTLRSRAMGSVDCFLTRLEEKLEDFPRGFNSFYNSPIYEERKAGTGISRLEHAQPRCISPSRAPGPKDYEIQRLNAEISQLKNELLNCESKRSCSPAKKIDFQSFPRAPTPQIETPSSPPPMMVPDLSMRFRLGLDVPQTDREYSLSNQGSEGLAREMDGELPDDPFEEMKTVTTKSRQNGWTDCPERNNIGRLGDFAEMKTSNTKSRQSGWTDYPERNNVEGPGDFQEMKTRSTKSRQTERTDYPERNNIERPGDFQEMNTTNKQSRQTGRTDYPERNNIERPGDFQEMKMINTNSRQNGLTEYPQWINIERLGDCQEMKTVTTNPRQNGWTDYSERNNFEGPEEFSHRRPETITDDRSWVSVLDEDNEEQSEELSEAPMDYSSRYGGEDDSMVSADPNPDKGEMQVLKSAVLKLSNMFWEQEGRLKNFKDVGANKAENDSSQTINLRDFYVELLKGMSHQLGELCCDLQISTQSIEKPHHTETIDAATVPVGYLREGVHNQTREGGTNHFLAKTLNSETEQLSNATAEHEYLDAQGGNLWTVLNAAEKKIEEEVNANLLLKEKLESGSKYLSQVIEEHAQEVARKDENINLVQQMNAQLANDMSQTDKSLAELRTRYKGLVATLEGQLQEVRNEVTTLQDSMHSLKIEIVRKENLVSKLEVEKKEQDSQIEEMKVKLQASQVETANAEVMEKSDLTKTFHAMKKDADVQNQRIIELVSINEDLIAYSHIKEDEIATLVKTVRTLQQNLQDKTDEASKMAVEAVKFSQGVVEARKESESYRLRCKLLGSKLEETEQELTAREDSMERLTRHLGKTIEGQDLILGENEQLLLSLNKAQYKERRMDDQLRQSKIIVQDLEDKISSMDVEINKARFELADMKAKGEEALAIERQAGEMRNRVHQLEEEIMEKEGQISILKTSFPGEYDSTY